MWADRILESQVVSKELLWKDSFFDFSLQILGSDFFSIDVNLLNLIGVLDSPSILSSIENLFPLSLDVSQSKIAKFWLEKISDFSKQSKKIIFIFNIWCINN